jgi:hypothetical protein
MEHQDKSDALNMEIQWAFKIGSNTTVHVQTNVGYFNKFLEECIDEKELVTFFNNSDMSDWDDLKNFLADLFYHAMESMIMPSMRVFTNNNSGGLINGMEALTITQVDNLDGVIDDATSFEAIITVDPDDMDEPECEYDVLDEVHDLKDGLNADDYNSMPALVQLVTAVIGENVIGE